MPAEKSKTCMVPSCAAVNSAFPDRIFFVVPENKKKQWLEIVGGDFTIEANKRMFCCENHFSIKRDIVGYHFYKVFGGRIKLEDHAYPHKNLGENVTVPRNRLPIIPIMAEEIPKSQEKDESDDESVDPLATTTDHNDNGSEDESDHNPDNTGFDLYHVSSDSDEDGTKFDSSHLPRSEEIIVTSDVYMRDDDDYSDSDDIPLKTIKAAKSSTSKTKVKEKDVGDSSAVASKYNCSQCGKNLSSSRSLKRHVKTFHVDEQKRVLSCHECRVIFASRDEYVKHKLVHKKSFECDACAKTFRTRFLLKSHYVQHINEKPFLCEICSRPFARMATLQKHRFTHVTEKTFVCEACGKSYSANFLLKQHIHQYHTNNTTVMCSQCSKIFTSTALLNIHIKAYHDEVNPYECEVCKLHFKHPSALLRHRKRFHDPRSSFTCDLCPKMFTKREMLERHMKTHSNKPTMQTLDTKLKSAKEKASKSTAKTVFECKECGITLCRPDRLRAHLASLHNPQNPHKCDTCRQTFPTELLMNQHVMRSHAPEHEYIYKCYICPKKYNQEAALKRHVKLHTDPKKPVTCELCGKTLGRPNRLKPHMRALHNPNNPFKCTICLQTFKEQKMLDSHTTQVHDQTIVCQYCSKTFGKHDGLLQHLRRNHSDLLALGKEIKLETDVE